VKPKKYHAVRTEEVKFQGISKDKNEIQAHTRKTNNKNIQRENKDTWKKLCLRN
jgi:hypothetical protein